MVERREVSFSAGGESAQRSIASLELGSGFVVTVPCMCAVS